MEYEIWPENADEIPEGFVFQNGEAVVNRQEIMGELHRAYHAGEITQGDVVEVVDFLDLLEFAYDKGVRICLN